MVSDDAAVHRGEIWWADMPEPRRSEPGLRRPVLIVQADLFNRSRMHTLIVAVITSNLRLADVPGTVLLRGPDIGLNRDSVVNLAQLYTLDRAFLTEMVGILPSRAQGFVDAALRLVLHL